MRSIVRIGPLLTLCLAAAGCDDSTSTEIPIFLVTDTVEVVAPLPGNEGLPTAIDITFDQVGGINGGRFPERSRDALQWDFAVRVQGNELVLVPANVVGVINSRAGLTRALTGQTLESILEAPSPLTFLTDSAVVMRTGEVYVARSRDIPTGFGGGACSYYGKFQPLLVDVATGTLRFQIVANQCGDPRLVPPE